MNIGKIVLTMFGLIALFLVLSKGDVFNEILKTASSAGLKGVTLLQGRNLGDAGLGA